MDSIKFGDCIKYSHKNVSKYYPSVNEVFASLNGDKDDGFYISFEDNSYTYIELDMHQIIYNDSNTCLVVSFCHDNFNKSRYFKIVYDTIQNTFEITDEFNKRY